MRGDKFCWVKNRGRGSNAVGCWDCSCAGDVEANPLIDLMMSDLSIHASSRASTRRSLIQEVHLRRRWRAALGRLQRYPSCTDAGSTSLQASSATSWKRCQEAPWRTVSGTPYCDHANLMKRNWPRRRSFFHLSRLALKAGSGPSRAGCADCQGIFKDIAIGSTRRRPFACSQTVR